MWRWATASPPVVGLADMKYNIAQIGYDLRPNFEGYSSQCYTALVGKGLGLDRQHAINLGLPSPDEPLIWWIWCRTAPCPR